jgi:hypothetical protein
MPAPTVPLHSLNDPPPIPEPVVVPAANQAALPRRQPKTTPPPQVAAPTNPDRSERTPEQVRSMLSSYQSGVQRGRDAAVAPTGSAPPPPNAPPPTGNPVRTTRPTVGQSARTPEEVRETLMKYRSGITRGRQPK